MMNKIYPKVQILKKLIPFIAIFAINSVHGQTNVVPFTLTNQIFIKGNITQLSNVMVRSTVTGVMFPNPSSSGNAINNNQDNTYQFVNVDPVGNFNSSSGTLALGAPCRKVALAVLYWTGKYSGSANQAAASAVTGFNQRTEVKVKGPGASSFTTFTADGINQGVIIGGNYSYSCRKDITSFINSFPNNGNGVYTVANVQGVIAADQNTIGWSLIVVYEDELQTMKQFTFFDGMCTVGNTNAGLITISGFLTPPVGAVGLGLGVINLDGDRADNDFLYFSTNPANLTNNNYRVFDALNPVTDFSNSTATLFGNTLAGANPAFTNLLGYDSDIITPNNGGNTLLGNNIRTAYLRAITASENIGYTTFITIIESYGPEIDVEAWSEDLNGGSLQPNDVLRININTCNNGNDGSLRTRIVQPLNALLTPIPNSITISGFNAGVKTDALGDDQAEFLTSTTLGIVNTTLVGRLGNGANATLAGYLFTNSIAGNCSTISYRATVKDDCAAFGCSLTTITTDAIAYYIGDISSTVGYDLSRSPLSVSGCKFSQSLFNPVAISACSPPSDMTVSGVICTTLLSSIFTAPGYQFFNSLNVLTPNPTVGGVYTARRDLGNGCLDVATITLINFTVCNTVTAVNDSFITPEISTLIGSVLSNDFNPVTGSSSGLTVSGLTLTGSNLGTFTFTNSISGTFVYVTNANLAVPAITSYVYRVCNSLSVCANATATITINGINDAPVASLSGINNSTINTISGFANLVSSLSGFDADGTVTSFIINYPTSLAGAGVFVVNGNTITGNTTILGAGPMAVRFDPVRTFTGLAQFTFNVRDSNSVSGVSNALYSVSVVGFNNPPTAILNTNSTNEEIVLNGTITGFSDLDGDLVAVTTFSGTVTGGNITINSNGSYTFTPASNYNGVTTVTYIVCDNYTPQACTSNNLIITVVGVNDAPFVSSTPITITGTAGTSTVRTITGFGDIDNPLTQLTVSGLNPISIGANGTINTITGGRVTISGSGLVTFQSSVPGIYTINYQVCDPTITCTSAVLTLSISGAPPIAIANTTTTSEGVAVSGNVMSNDQNPNTGNSTVGLTVTGFSQIGASQGTLSATSSGGNFTFTPNVELAQGVTTTTAFNYTVCNNSGCSSTTLTITITGLNDAPVATNVNTSTTSNTSISGTVPFTDPDGIVTVTSQNVTNPTGRFTVSTTGGYTFIPNGTFTGISTFTVTGCDAFVCSTSIVTITVTANTLNPTAINDINNVLESGTTTGNVLTNDINPITGNNTQLTISGITVQSPLGTTIITNSLTGAYTFIPNASVELAQGQTTTTSAVYRVCNVNGCSTAQIAITITGVNDAPVATNVNTSTTSNTSILGIVPFTDPDGLVTVTSQNVTNPTGRFTVSTTGGYTFIPNGTFTGISTFTVTGCDAFVCANAIVTITVTANTLNPTAVNDINTVNESGTVTGNVLTNDINPITGTNSGLTVSGIAVQSPLGTVTITNSLTGAYTFIPNASVELAQGQTTTTSAVYRVCNVNGCSTAQIAITITGVNDAPVATNVSTSTTSNTSISGTVPFTDTDGIVTVTSQNVTNPTGRFTVSTTGGYTFIPNGTFTGISTFTVTGCDAFVCSTSIVTITVTANTLNPTAVNDINTVNESSSVTGNVLTNDINPITGNNSDLTVSGITVQSPLGTTIITNSLTGTYTFIPNASVELAQGQTTTTSAVYRVCNVNGCSTAQIAITITGVNDAPVATNVSTSTTSNTSISGTVPFTDPDGIVTVTSQIVTNPTGRFTVSTTGGYTFIPNGTFTGISTFTVTGCDAFVCANAIVTITVTANTLNPTAVNDINNVLESGTTTGNVLTNDINPITGNNSGLTISGITVQSPLGTTIITNSLTGAYTFVPNASVELAQGQTTTTSAVYQVCNINGCSTAQIAITITGVNDAPEVINNQTITGLTGVVNTTTIPGITDLDTPQNQLTLTGITGLPGGGATISGNNQITFTSTLPGLYTLTGTVCDPFTCTSISILVNITGQTPVPANDGFSTDENTNIVGNLLTNDFNPDVNASVTGLTLNTSPTLLGANIGTLSVNGTGGFTFVPSVELAQGVTTITSYTYQVCNNSGCASAQVVFTVVGVNDLPVGVGINTSTPANSSITGTISFTDPDNIVTVTSQNITNPEGVFTVNSLGGYTFVPNATFVGVVNYPVTACDPFTCTSAIITVTVTAPVISTSADVVVTIAGPVSVRRDEPIIFTVTGTNNGPDNANNVEIVVTIPSGLTGVVVSNGGTYNSVTGVITFPVITTLGLNESQLYNITITSTGTLAGISPSVSGTSSTLDSNNGNNTNVPSPTVLIENVTDLVIQIDGPSTTKANVLVSYTITVLNIGPDDADNVIVTVTIPGGVTNVIPCCGGIYNPATGVITYLTTTLGRKTAQTYTFSVVPESSTKSIVPTVSVSSSTLDLEPSNNNSTKSTLVESELTSTDLPIIPNGFSPNGDGVNEEYIITPPVGTAKTSLTVFNRWGNEIYANENYQNDWRGNAGKGAIISRTDGLPSGTYYVIVVFVDAAGKEIDKITKSITIMK